MSKKSPKDIRKPSRSKRRIKKLLKMTSAIKHYIGCEYPGCEIDDPKLLEFHHLVPDEKVQTISSLICHNGASIARIMAEIWKCDVLCNNHHDIVDGELHGRNFLPRRLLNQ